MGAGHIQGAKETFRREDWELVDSKLHMKTWANRREANFRVEQYDIFSEDQGKLNREEKTYYFRKNSKYLVASIYRQCQDQGSFCSTSYRQTLFIESIPIRLSDIQHIPYPDSLHLYNQSFIGFRQLIEEVGFFPVEQEFIGVNSNGIVKVWMNDHFEKSYVQGVRVIEEAMVKSIIDTIDRNVEQTQIPSVRSYLYRNSKLIKFNQAIDQFKQYVREFNRGQIPDKLDCIDRVGGINAIVNRQQGLNNQAQLQIQRNYAQPKPTQNIPTPMMYNGMNMQGHSQPTQSIFMPIEQINPHLNKQLRFVPMRNTENMVQKNVSAPLHLQQNLPIVRNSRIFDIRPVQMRQAQSSTKTSQILNQPVTSRLTQSSHQNIHLGKIALQNQPLMTKRSPSPQFPIESTRTSHSQPQQNKIVFHQQQRPQSHHPQGLSSLLIHTKQNQQPSIIQPNIKESIIIQGAPIASTVISSAKSSQIYQKNTSISLNNAVSNPLRNYNQFNSNPLNFQLRSITAQPLNVEPKFYNNTSLNQKISFSSNPQGIKIQPPKMELFNQSFNNSNRFYPPPQKNQYRPSLVGRAPIININSNEVQNIKQIGTQNNFVPAQQTPVDGKFKLSIDDGKSSDQFLRILKGTSSIKQNNKQSLQFRNTFENKQKNFSPQITNKIGQYSLAEQIGRSAVSHHLADLQPQTHNVSREIGMDSTKNEPSYNINSTVNSESPQPYKYKYSSLNYQPSYDPQVMADMNKLKPDS